MVARPTVLVMIKGLGVGGAEKLVSEGSRFWDTGRFDYRVAYQLPWKDQLVGDLEANGVPVTCVGGSEGRSATAALRLRRHLRSVGADLIHAHLPAAGVMARIVSGSPLVYTEHNLAGSYRQPTRSLNRLTYGLNDAVTAVSEPVAASLAGYPGPPARVIPNGVAVRVTPEDQAAARLELGLSAAEPLVAHVGNIRPHKGHETLVAAARELARLRPSATIVSIGGEKHPGDLDRVRAAARDAGVDGSLRFLGRRSDALAFVAAADVFVNPSDVEGLPVAILEALALGTPVVATDVGGVGTVVDHEATGILVDRGDAVELAAGIDRVLGDPGLAERLARQGRQLVDQEYGLERMVRAFEGVYDEVLGA